MKNAYAIGDLAGLLGKNAEVIGNIAMGMNNAEQGDNLALVESYKGMLLNSLETAQHSILALTELVTEITQDQEERGDSVFMPGELDDDMGGEKNVEHPGGEEEEK